MASCSKQDVSYNTTGDTPEVERIYVSANNPKYTIELEQVLSLNQLEEAHLASMWGIYEDENGYIYWQDNRGLKVHQYSVDGHYVRSFGKKGEGPGELTALRYSAVSGNQLLLSDDVSQQVLIFDTISGDYLRTVKVRLNEHEELSAWMFDIQTESDSTFIVEPIGFDRSNPDSSRLFRYHIDGSYKRQSFFSYRRSEALEGRSGNGTFRTPAAFNAKSEVNMRPGGGWIHSYAREPEFYIYDADGTLTKIIHLNDIEAVELTRDHILYEIDNSNAMIDLERSVRNANDVPDYWPLWDKFFISASGNLWLEVNTNPPYEREWWVLSQDGELLSKLLLSEDTALRYIGDNHLITSTYPDGIMYVNRYRFQFRPYHE